MFEIIDGPYPVDASVSAGDYFVAAGEPVPYWFPTLVIGNPSKDVIIEVNKVGWAVMRYSLGAAEHR